MPKKNAPGLSPGTAPLKQAKPVKKATATKKISKPDLSALQDKAPDISAPTVSEKALPVKRSVQEKETKTVNKPR